MFKINTKVDDYMSIVVTHECNRKCPFCIDSYRGRNEYITLANVERALRYAKENNIKDILLVGGEPTLHPDIVLIAKMAKEYGFNVILTTNYSKPEVVKELDQYVDSFNISWYRQSVLPNPKEFTADITLSALIFNGQLDSKEKIDEFIDKYGNKYILKFSTLTVCNEFTKSRQYVPYLDDLDGEKVVLFDEIGGLIYRNCIIKRYDKVISSNAKQSVKCHVDGLITNTWQRNI